MDNDFSVDLAEIVSSIRANEVVAVRFVTMPQRLLLDFRLNDVDGPMIRVAEPVRSVQERYETLKQWRPRFDAPERIVALWWPRFARSLEATGIWDEVMRRVSESGHPDAVRNAQTALAELKRCEERHQRAAVRGKGFRTMWSASPSRR